VNTKWKEDVWIRGRGWEEASSELGEIDWEEVHGRSCIIIIIIIGFSPCSWKEEVKGRGV